MDAPLSIYLAHARAAARSSMSGMLRELGHRVDVLTDSGSELIAAVKRQPPDLLISAVQLRDMDGTDALVQCGQEAPVPSIVVSRDTDQQIVEKALRDHVMAFLAEPVCADDLGPTIYLVQQRFAEFRELLEENQALKQSLEARKWVERAKGVLMRRENLDESQAYRLLQRMASDNRKKLGTIARSLVESDELLEET